MERIDQIGAKTMLGSVPEKPKPEDTKCEICLDPIEAIAPVGLPAEPALINASLRLVPEAKLPVPQVRKTAKGSSLKFVRSSISVLP